MAKIKIELFGPLTMLGKNYLQIDIPDRGITVKNLKKIIANKHDLFKNNIRSIAIVKNDNLTTENEKIMPNDTVSLLPPVSGG